MRKKELLAMQVLKLTGKMRQSALGLKPWKEFVWSTNPHFRYIAYIRAAVEKDILRIEVYFTEQIRNGLMEPAYRIFFDNVAEDFITFDTDKKKWTTKRIDNLSGPVYLGDTEQFWWQAEEQKVFETYLGLKSYTGIVNWQQSVREEQRLRAFSRRADKWDEIMKSMPSLPKDWDRWLLKNVIQEHYMFYEYKRSRQIVGRCSRCGKEQMLYKPRYNKKATCKNCKYPVTYKSVGKAGRILSKRYTAHILQRMDKGVVSRQFVVYALYPDKCPDKMEIHLYEERRVILDDSGEMKAYYFGEYKDGKMHWIKTDVSWHYAKKGVVYRRTLPDLAKKELIRTGLWEVSRTCQPFSPEIYLSAVKYTPLIEKAAKAGLTKLALDLADWKYEVQLRDAGELHRCLCIDRNQMKRLRINHGGTDYLKWLQYESKCQKRIDDEVITWFTRHKIKVPGLLLVEGKMSPRQIMNYLIKQQKIMPGKSISEILSLWQDYLDMAKRFGLDINDAIIYRASNLELRHDELVKQMEEQQRSVKAQEILDQYPDLNAVLASLKGKYEYQDDTYAVLVPEKVQDILREGEALHHCINKTDNYYERISKNETYILFLRKTNELSVPYYTLEVEPGGTIRQKRTKFNRQGEDIADASKFLLKWQKTVRQRMSESDLELSERSRQLRNEKYKKLREDEVRIGGGTCEGKLLADILEADLMELADAA